MWSEKRPIRKTVVNHTQRVKQAMDFGMKFDSSPTVMQELSQEGPFTLFCPTNEAMSKIKTSAWDRLWEEDVDRFMRHHVIKGKWGIEDLAIAAMGDNAPPISVQDKHAYELLHPKHQTGQPQRLPLPINSLAKQELSVTTEGSLEDWNRVVRIGGAAITKSNIRCWNGYVHFIDRPLIPRWH